MGKALFNKATGRREGWVRRGDIPHDQATHVIVDQDEMPDKETMRWNGIEGPGAGVRLATQAELDQDIADKAQAEETHQFDGHKMLKALAVWIAKKQGIPLNTAKDEILAEFRKL